MARYRLNADGTPWTIFTPATSRGAHSGRTFSAADRGVDVPLLTYFRELEDTEHEAHVAHLLRLLQEVIPQHPLGPRALPAKIHVSHTKTFDDRAVKSGAKREMTFYRIRSGALRVVFFYMGRSVVICTHSYIKDVQKTPPEQQTAANDAYLRYIEEFGE